MNLNLRQRLSQFHSLCQYELLPLVEADLVEVLTPPLQQLLRIWALVQVERWVPYSRGMVGRPARV